jgi:hypothetical protein
LFRGAARSFAEGSRFRIFLPQAQSSRQWRRWKKSRRSDSRTSAEILGSAWRHKLNGRSLDASSFRKHQALATSEDLWRVFAAKHCDRKNSLRVLWPDKTMTATNLSLA